MAKTITPVEYYGKMRVKGNQIIGEKTGEVVQVTGMSFFWSNWSHRFYTADMVKKAINKYHSEVIRAAYGIQNDGTPYDRDDVSRIKTVIEAAINNGIYVLIDWHAHGAHKNPEEAIAYFTMMAKEYGHYDNIIFELYNEPMNVEWPIVKEYEIKLISEIRKYSDNLIIAGTTTWSQDVDIASLDPIDDSNTAYSLHFYAGTHKQELRDKADTAIKNGAALFISEWGSVNADGNGGIDKESTAQWFDWIMKNKLSSCNWAFNDRDETSSVYSETDEDTTTGLFIKNLINDCNKAAKWKEGANC